MNLNEDIISGIVTRVVKRLNDEDEMSCLPGNSKCTGESETVCSCHGIFSDLEEAVSAAKAAKVKFAGISLKVRAEIIASIRKNCTENVEAFSRMAIDEVGLGRYEDKLKKNRLAIDKTPGTEILQPQTFTGDYGLTLVERAPYGVIASIPPCTNPTETIICNVIGMVAGGNSVVINAHPSAKNISAYCISVINDAIVSAGGPANLVTAVKEPTIATAQALMKHPDVNLLVVTGGPAVVKAAMASGKKVIAAGPGNPPVVVDETADIKKAAIDIVNGASFDNNVVCVLEKEIIAVASIADELKREMKNSGAYEITDIQARTLEKLVLTRDPTDGHLMVNKNFVGKDAGVILKEIGIITKGDVRLIIVETEKDHPFVLAELLMPIMPLVRVSNADEAIALAKEVEHGNHHTAVMHSKNIDNLSKMARVCNASIFVKNAPSYAGLGFEAEGYTSFTIASPTGEGLTCATDFTRERRCSLVGHFRIT
jgi:acyl-CoA reductase-like NAD-dependent aldehyde dehydrogenase